jgi:hypothetical protein
MLRMDVRMAAGSPQRFNAHRVALGAAEVAVGFDGNVVAGRGLYPGIHQSGRVRKRGLRWVANAM